MDIDKTVKVSILTISDRCYQGKSQNLSGPKIKCFLEESVDFACQIVDQKCCSDDESKIIEIVLEWCDSQIDLIITSGGTGLAQRDVTPEAIKKILIKESPGLSLLMVSESLKVTPLAALSRPVCGIIGKNKLNTGTSFVVTLPGSHKAACECLGFVSPVLKHAIDLMRENLNDVETTHKAMQSVKKSKVDVSNIAKRDRKSPYAMVLVSEAVSIVLSKSFSLQSHSCKLRKSKGFAIAEDVVAEENLPPFPASIKDGYAVITSDGAGERTVVGQSYAGIDPSFNKLLSGSCVRINTGAPVPLGADAVVQVEDTELLKTTEDGKEELLIRLMKEPLVNQDIREIGSDIKKGQLLYPKNTVIGPSEVGVLASAGVSSVMVFDKPKVAVLSTGNELQSPDIQPLKKGFIYDSNKETLIFLLEQFSFEAIDAGVAPDDPTSMKMSIERAFDVADILVTSGSVSMGEKDILRPVLINDFEATIHFAQVFMKPGKPTTFATCNYKHKPKIVLGLPGNPVSAVVTSHLYLIPLLRKMSGYGQFTNTVIKAKLSRDMRLDPRPEYHRVSLKWEEEENVPVAQSTGNQISSRLLSFSKAQALLLLPPAMPDRRILSQGTIVEAILLSI